MDQFVARGLALFVIFPSTAGPQPNGALSVDGRGRSEEAMDTGRGLLGSRSEKLAEGSSMLEPNMLKPRRRLASMFRAGAGAFPSLTSPAEPRVKKLGMFQLVEKLIRRGRLVVSSGSSVERGNDWLCPCFKLPKAGPSPCIVFPLARVNMSFTFPKPR